VNSVLKAWADLPAVFADRLMALLGEQGRRTHGLHHVNQLLLEADRHAQQHWLRPLRWALLYHCAVHDPLAPARENARASAELWREHAPAIVETVRGVSPTFEQEVGDAIETPLFERPAGFLPWQHAFCDLRLGWLGEPEGLFAARRAWDAAAAAEAGASADIWHVARRAAMDAALACETIYHRIHVEREAHARRNAAQDRAGAYDRACFNPFPK
jgi:hypothetical protein